jgi:hypothetical protein
MRSRCWPQGWHAWWPSSASTAGSGTGYSTCALVLALDADIMGQQQWRQLARQATLWGKRVSVLESVAYGGQKDVSAAWAAGVLAVGAGPAAVAVGGEGLAMSQHQRESWAERVAIMVTDGSVRPEDAERLAWAGLQPSSDAR